MASDITCRALPAPKNPETLSLPQTLQPGLLVPTLLWQPGDQSPLTPSKHRASPAPSLCQHCPLTKKAFFLSSLLRNFPSSPEFLASHGNLEAWATPDPTSSKAAGDRNWGAAVPLRRHVISVTQPHPASSPARPPATAYELVVPASVTHIPLASLDQRLLITKASSSHLCPCHRAPAGKPSESAQEMSRKGCANRPDSDTQPLPPTSRHLARRLHFISAT